MKENLMTMDRVESISYLFSSLECELVANIFL